MPVYTAFSWGDRWDLFFPLDDQSWEHRTYSNARWLSSQVLQRMDLDKAMAALGGRWPEPLKVPDPTPQPTTPTSLPGRRP
jgi:hypothetical protein